MEKFLYAQYMDGFDDDGRKRCSCGQTHALRTREILLGAGAASAIPERIRGEYGGRTTVWILSDERTEEAAGAALKRDLAGLPLAETVLPGSPRPTCTRQLAEVLAARAQTATAGLILSVGGGTLSDLGKLVSLKLGVPNWALMTTPSMDAHASGTANAKSEAGAVTLPAAPSSRIFCDLEVLRRAPEELFLAGLGDQLAKIVGYLDWRLGAWVFDEAICLEAADTSLRSARLMLEALREPEEPPGRLRLKLADALLASGLVMQSLGHSRPAASAEHSAAHFWETAHFARNPRLALHGLLVGAATAWVYQAYRTFFELLPDWRLDIEARERALSREASWEQSLDEQMLPYRALLERVNAGRIPAARTCRESLRRFAERRMEIQVLGEEILDELGRGLRLLSDRGFPFDLADYGFNAEEVRLAFRYIRFLRNRSSAFDLMHLLGVERQIYESLPNGTRPPTFAGPGPV